MCSNDFPIFGGRQKHQGGSGKRTTAAAGMKNKCIHTYKLRTAECTKTHNVCKYELQSRACGRFVGILHITSMFSEINSYNILICVLYWLIAWLIDTGLLQLYVVHISPI